MKKDINLLPRGHKPSETVTKSLAALKKVNTAVFIIVLLGGLAGGGYLFFVLNQVRNASAETERIRGEITSLQASEQKLVIVRDRITKIKPVLDDTATQDSLEKLSELVSAFSDSVTLSESQVEKGSIKIKLVATDSSRLAQMLVTLESATELKAVSIGKIEYSPGTGFQVDLTLT